MTPIRTNASPEGRMRQDSPREETQRRAAGNAAITGDKAATAAKPFGRLVASFHEAGCTAHAVAYPFGNDTTMDIAYVKPSETFYVENNPFWEIDVSLRNDRNGRSLRILDFLGLDGTPWNYCVRVGDSSVYEPSSDRVIMGMPDSPFWLGEFLHEIGHKRQEGKHNAAKDLDPMYRILAHPIREKTLPYDTKYLKSAFRPPVFASFARVCGILIENRILSPAEAEAGANALRHLIADAVALPEKISPGSFSHDLPINAVMRKMFVRCGNGVGVLAFSKIISFAAGILERDATKYALMKLRAIDRELSTDISSAVFEGPASEDTIPSYLEKAL